MLGLFKKEKSMSEQVVHQMSSLITSAFGLVAALAWNDAIKAILDRFFKKGDGLTAQLVYAVVITLFAVIATVWLGRIAAKVAELKIMKKL